MKRKQFLSGALCAALLTSLFTLPSHAVSGTVTKPDGSPLSGATVTCEIKEGSTWRTWASESYKIEGDLEGDATASPDYSGLKEGAEDYGQSPTMFTGENGRCGWMLPSGTFRFKVTAEGYKDLTSQEFTVGTEAQAVNNSFDLGTLKLTAGSGDGGDSGDNGNSGNKRPGYTPWLGGSVSSESSQPKTAELITLNLTAGTVTKGSKLTLTPTDKATDAVTFLYTTDGSTPTRNSTKYTEAIVIDKDMTIKIAALQGTTLGTVETYSFTVTDARPGSLKPDAASIRYLVGYSDGTFRPNQPITRYEVAEALTYLLVLGDGSTATAFSDVQAEHASAVARLTEAGLINGMGNGTFQGENSLTRAQIAKILCLVLELEPDAQSAASSFSDIGRHWGAGYIGALTQAGYFKGYTDGTFRPDQPMTRAELAALLNRVAQRKDVTGQAPEYTDVAAKFWGYEDVKNASLPITAEQ